MSILFYIIKILETFGNKCQPCSVFDSFCYKCDAFNMCIECNSSFNKFLDSNKCVDAY